MTLYWQIKNTNVRSPKSIGDLVSKEVDGVFKDDNFNCPLVGTHTHTNTHTHTHTHTHTQSHLYEHTHIKYYFFKDLLYEYTVAVFRHTRRGHWIPFMMVVTHHVVAGN